MKLNLIIGFYLIIATILQFSINISPSKTMLSYIIPIAYLVTRPLFFISCFGISIPDKFGPISELIIAGLSFFLFFMTGLKNEFNFYWFRIAADILISISIISIMAFMNLYYIIFAVEQEEIEDLQESKD